MEDRAALLSRAIVQSYFQDLQHSLLEPKDYSRFGTLLGVPADVVEELLSKEDDMKDRAAEIIEYSLKNKKVQHCEVLSAIGKIKEVDSESLLSRALVQGPFQPLLQRVPLGPNDYYRLGTSLGVPADVLKGVLSEKNDMEDGVAAIIEYLLKSRLVSAGELTTAIGKMIEEKSMDHVDEESAADPHINLVVTPSAPPREIAVCVQEEIAQSLDKIKGEFASLVMDIQDALEHEVNLDQLTRYLKFFLEDTFKPRHDPCRNIDDVFDGLEEHYCFINYKILRIVVEKFICNKATPSAVKDYDSELNKWLESTTVQEFKAAVEIAATPVSTDPSPNQYPVVLRLEGEWMKITIKNLKRLLKYLFRKKSSILTNLIIKEGSVLIRMAAPRSEILSLLTLASWKYEEMPYLGIISVQVGSLILCAQKKFPYPFTFELGLSAAIVCSHCNPALIDHLLKLGANPNAKNQDGKNLITIATIHLKTNALSLLLKYQADPHMFDAENFMSAIHYAAGLGQLELVDLLLKAGVSPNLHSPTDKFTPLMSATLQKQTGMVKFLLQNGADVDIQDIDGHTGLYEACKCCHLPIARLLLKAGANPNIKTNKSITPLFIASMKGYVELVELLLRFNADPNLKCTVKGFTPLMAACGSSNSASHKIVKLLLQSGAYVNCQASDGTGITALHMASVNNDSHIMSVLLNAEADVNLETTPNCGTPLMALCLHRNDEMVQRFLEAGADPNLGSITPLHCGDLNKKIYAMLLDAGGDPNIVCTKYFNLTPLHCACTQNNEDIVQLLLKAKANTNVLNSKGVSPLSIAVSKGNVKIVEALLAAGADVELAGADIELGNDGDRVWRPIFLAAINGHLPILNLLLKRGASLKGDKFGITPQAIVVLMGHVEAQVLLQSYITKSTEKDVSDSTPELDIQTCNNIISYYKKFQSDLSSSMESFQKTLTNMASFATNISQYV